jgi:hypothetical protein
MKKVLFLSFLVFAVFCLFISSPINGQDLSIVQTTVDDGNYTSYCHPNFGNFQIKGNLDGALSPGERVRLNVKIKNNTGYDITSLSGIIYSSNPYVNVYSPNCYDGTIGVRYSCPIENNKTAGNFDPFIIEVSQDAPCGEFIDFGVTFYYTTSSGNCSTQCTENHYFSLPVFSFQNDYDLNEEVELFQSANNQFLIGAASNGSSIGIFFNGDDGIYFGETNLVGTPTLGPSKIYNSSIPSYDDILKCSTFYNTSKGVYAFVNKDLLLMEQGGETYQLTIPQGMAQPKSCYSLIYEESDNLIDLIAEDTNENLYFLKYNSSDYTRKDFHSFGSTNLDTSFSSIYSHGDYYIVAYEFYDLTTNTKKIKVVKLDKQTLNEIVTYVTEIDPYGSSTPSIAFDSVNNFILLAYSKDNGNNSRDIYSVLLDTNLQEKSSPKIILSSQPNRTLTNPKIVKTFDKFALVFQDNSTISGNSSKIKLCAFTLEDLEGNQSLQPIDATSEWIGIRKIHPFFVEGTLFNFWSDTRQTINGKNSLHYFRARFFNANSPYNVDFYDDTIISQPYDKCYFPSLACKDNECLASWVYSDSSNYTNIYMRKFDLNGNPQSQIEMCTNFNDVSISRIFSLVKDDHYHIFWLGRDNTLNQNYVGRYIENSNPQKLFYLTDSSSSLLDVTLDGSVFLVKDKKSGDSNYSLYLYRSSGEYSKIFEAPSDEVIISSKIITTSNYIYPYGVAYLVSNSTLNQSYLNFLYIDNDLTPVSGSEQTLKTFSTANNLGEFAISSNENRTLLLYSRPIDSTYNLELTIYRQHPLNPEGTKIVQSSLATGDQYDLNPFSNPKIVWNRNKTFTLSWIQRQQTSSGNERNLYYAHLNDFGEFISPPIRIESSIAMFPHHYYLDGTVVSTKKGALAIYLNESSSDGNENNIFLTPLYWADSNVVCSLFNTPPVVSTSGPFTIEYGSGVTLQGTAIDDTAMGDSITYAGWDITQDGVPDFNGLTTTITFDQLKQKGWLAPKTANVTLFAKDRQGATGYSTTTLTIQDTTPPNVSVIFPNGGETLVNGRSYTILWNGSDNYQISSYSIYYCTDWNGSNGTWIPIATGLSASTNSYDWTIPDILSSTCRIKVVAEDASPAKNTNYDLSDSNFYLVQATTSSIKTLVLYSASRMENFYPGKSSLISEKLAKLISNDKVNGFVVDLDSIPGLSALYGEWDLDPTNQTKANNIANAIRNYVKDLVNNTYTNCEYLVIVGDDRMVPFFRIQDATPNSYSENDYTGGSDCSTTVGSALCQNYYLTDNNYGDLGHFENGEWKEYETTSAGSHYMALPDLAIGRLIETPDQIATTIDVFITLDGQITLDSLTSADIFTSGYTFLNDSAETIDSKYGSQYVVDHLLGDSWSGDQLKSSIFSHPHKINSINGHSNHYTLFSPDRGVTSTEMNSSYPGTVLTGTVFYNVGCHSGLNVPQTFSNSYDLPEMMMEKGSLAYIGNTGFGWGLKEGSGYGEKLMELVTDKMLYYDMSSLGKSLIEAKREYFINDKRYDVFDEKVLFESTLYGLPMFKIVMRQNGAKEPPKDFSGPLGPDEEEVNGIKLKKQLVNSSQNNLLPPGVTELSLQFDFGPQTYQLINTPDGQYFKLNGRSNGEAGDTLQPLFTYESRLSGVVSHGVIFTGGTFVTYNSFDPAVATPQSSSPIIPPEPIAPVGAAFIPTVNVTHPKQPTSLTATDFTKMVVYTGYFDSSTNVETIFNTMNFSVYYSNSTDKTPPTIVDPGVGNNLHTLNGTLCKFSVSASDSDSGIYRVIVTYTDGISQWNSIDLNYNSSNSKWEGSLNLKRNITYFVQAVDNAGNVKVLSLNEGLGDINPETGLPYVVGARIFKVQLLDQDNDGMEDTWEIQHGLNPTLNDANGDPDYDGLTNYEEFLQDTEPNNADTDGDGDNDGSELHNGRNPLSSDDGKRITITVEKVGNDIVIHFEDTLGENSVIDGPYWVYRSINDPHFDNSEILVTNPYPLPDGTTSYTDVGAASGTETYYYTVVNARFNSPAPVIDAVVPSSGPTSGGTTISVYGSNFSNGATVKIGGVNCTNVVVVNSTKITCTTPANSSGAKDVVVTNLNGPSGTLTNGYTYY